MATMVGAEPVATEDEFGECPTCTPRITFTGSGIVWATITEDNS